MHEIDAFLLSPLHSDSELATSDRRNASAVDEAKIRARKMRQKIRIAAKRERETENEIGVGREGRG